MKTAFVFIVMSAFLLAACSTNPQSNTDRNAPLVPPAEQLPQEPAAPSGAQGPAQASNTVAKPESGTDKTFGTVNTTSALKIDDVLCDKAAQKITFRFKNTDTKDWQLNQQVPFPAPKDLAAVRVFINSYEANNANGYIKDGVRFFGPATKFSDNCGGIEVLKAGADATCTLVPVPIKSATGLSAGKNNIFVDSPTSHHVIEFLCD